MGVMPEEAFSCIATNFDIIQKDFYGCYCLKFVVQAGTHITEEKVEDDFKAYGEVVDVRGPGLYSGLRGNYVYVRFVNKADAERALERLGNEYHQLSPANINEVLPDNYGLYTVSFYNKTGIPSEEVRKEFSKFGEVKNLSGSLDTKGGRVFVGFSERGSAITALQALFSRKDNYPNMKFALPKCEKDYFGCYCLKFYNKSNDDVETLLKDFSQFGEVVDIRGPGIFEGPGDDVYVRFKDKVSAELALHDLMGKYNTLCLAPPSDIQADKFGFFTITFVNEKVLSKSDIWLVFSKFGTVASISGALDQPNGRVFVSYKEKQGALNALETMLSTKEYHLQVSKNSTVRKADYYVTTSSKDPPQAGRNSHDSNKLVLSLVDNSSSLPFVGNHQSIQNVEGNNNQTLNRVPVSVPHQETITKTFNHLAPIGIRTPKTLPPGSSNFVPSVSHKYATTRKTKRSGQSKKANWMAKFNRSVEKDLFGYYCLSFLNDDGDISEKKVRHSFGQFGEVVNVRGALGKQRGHVFVRFRNKEAAENCLHCFNSFPLSEMSKLFGKYLFLSPATPRDIKCDMYGLYNISFLNFGAKTFDEIFQEFSKFGEVSYISYERTIHDEHLITISFLEKDAAVNALKVHFANMNFPNLDIAKGCSVLSVPKNENSSGKDEKKSSSSAGSSTPGESHHKIIKGAIPMDPFLDSLTSNSWSGGSSIAEDYSLQPMEEPEPKYPIYGSSASNFWSGGSTHDYHQKSIEGAEPRGPFHYSSTSNSNSWSGGSSIADDYHQKSIEEEEEPNYSMHDSSIGNSWSGGSSIDDDCYQTSIEEPVTRDPFRDFSTSKSCSLGSSMAGSCRKKSIEDPEPKYPLRDSSTSHSLSGVSSTTGSCHQKSVKNPEPKFIIHDSPASNSLSIGGSCYQKSNEETDPWHPFRDSGSGNGGSNIADELLRPFQGYLNIYRTGQFGNLCDEATSYQRKKGLQEIGWIGKKLQMERIKKGLTNWSHPDDAPFTPVKSTKSSCSPSVHSKIDCVSTGPMPSTTSGCTPSVMPESTPSLTDASPSIIPKQQDLLVKDSWVKSSEKPAHLHIDLTNVNRGLHLSQISGHYSTKGNPKEVEYQPVVNPKEVGVLKGNMPETGCSEDIFGLYSLAIVSKSEKNIKVDFGKYGDVVKIRGQFVASGTAGSNVYGIFVVSFSHLESAQSAIKSPALIKKYPSMKMAPPMEVLPDKNGHFSIDFGNSGMSSIKEILKLFASYGAVKEVSVAGGKNRIKQVKVSFVEKDSALEAIRCHTISEDFSALDFTKECLILKDPNFGTLTKIN